MHRRRSHPAPAAEDSGSHSIKEFAHDVQDRLHRAGSAVLQEGSNMLHEISEASSNLWGDLFGSEQPPAQAVPNKSPVERKPATERTRRPSPPPKDRLQRPSTEAGEVHSQAVRSAESATFTDETGESAVFTVGAPVWRKGQRCVIARFDPEVHGGLILEGDDGQEIATSAARVSLQPPPPSVARSAPQPAAIKLADRNGEVQELRVGDIVYRRGQCAIIRRFDREIDPPSLVVEMPDGREVGTEAELVSFSAPPLASGSEAAEEVLQAEPS
mmetsp:Transcript_11112/g.15720  ORF Transcript_11112/g.15720 Transcript_11112/m.15720 type:complete len:272 (-) Transcript_11112:139-954(-)